MSRQITRTRLSILLTSSLLIITLVVAAAHLVTAESTAASNQSASASSTFPVFLPVIHDGNPPLLCRFGVNAIADLANVDIVALRIGWYVDYHALSTPSEPKGAEYAPTIRLSQVGADGYTYTPSGSQLQEAILANPGAAWFIGNEPDRRFVQDDMEPLPYAKAYHELYYLIKSADPTAQIFAGTIVQPTPIRLQYLDMVLDSYQSEYGEPMPVDGWSIHNFLLNEVDEDRCEEVPGGCWGAGIPPGINALSGEIVTIEENDSINLFIERIERFRQWMADRGYAGLPVYLSEYGVLMPDDFGFPPQRVNTFMNQTFDYMLTATDPQLGDPNDGYRLIQKWSWYSTGAPGDPFNGNLFHPSTYALSAMGANYEAYTKQLAEEVELYPSRIFTDSSGPPSSSEPVTLTLKTQVANSGNLEEPTRSVAVRFYEGDPANGGVQIGSDRSVSLSGCGDNAIVEVVWTDVPPDTYQVYVAVDPENSVTETNESNNVASQEIAVGGE